MKIGYARTSTLEQVAGFEAQVRELETAGAQRTYKEQVSSVGPRPEFDRLMDGGLQFFGDTGLFVAHDQNHRFFIIGFAEIDGAGGGVGHG